jgi:hypothetical protein
MTLEQYQDLVFTPLALPTPPAVDSAHLVRWMTWAREESLPRGLTKSERGYEAQTGKQYPWLMATVLLAEPGTVEDSFQREFAPVVDYARRLPFKGVRKIFVIAQRAGGRRASAHRYRRLLVLPLLPHPPHREDLYFCMARERVAKLPPRCDDWSPLLDLSTKHYARWPAENRAYCLNSVRAAHAVEPNRAALGDRIACVVIPEGGHDEPRLLELLERSSAQFRDCQIWYRQPQA